MGEAIRLWQDWEGGADAAPAEVQRLGAAAANELVERNLRLVPYFGRQWLAKGYEPEEVDQHVAMGLIRAALKFDPSRGCGFMTHAKWWVRAEFYRFMNPHTAARIPNDVKLQQSKIYRAIDELRRQGKPVDYDSVSKATGIPRKRVIDRIVDSHHFSVPISLDQKLQGDDDYSDRAEVIGRDDGSWDKIVRDDDIRRLEEAMDNWLDEKTRALLKMYYYQGMTSKEIGERIGCSHTTVMKIAHAGVKRLRAIMAA